jgi:hypothetical protein
MPSEPLAYRGMLVGGVIVEDRMNGLSSAILALDRVEEADELLIARPTRMQNAPAIARHGS